jgi:hypothetical protein
MFGYVDCLFATSNFFSSRRSVLSSKILIVAYFICWFPHLLVSSMQGTIHHALKNWRWLSQSWQITFKVSPRILTAALQDLSMEELAALLCRSSYEEMTGLVLETSQPHLQLYLEWDARQ